MRETALSRQWTDGKRKSGLHYFRVSGGTPVAIGQQDKEKDPSKGYNQLLDYRMEKILPLMAKNKVKVITNMGAANRYLLQN